MWHELHVRPLPFEVFDELIKTYSSPDRFYHNLQHIEDCLSIWDETKFLAAHGAEVELAVWFHDAVYDTRRSDNEQKSAEWARSVAIQSGVHGEVAERVFNLVLATRHDREVTETDAQLIVDLDLSILGRKGEVFWEYEANIRKEYAWVPENLFREKRIEILQGFLSRRYIYHHAVYRERFEKQARVNLEQAISKLRDTRNGE